MKDNFAAGLAQVKLVTKIANIAKLLILLIQLVIKKDVDDKLKVLNKKVTSNKTKTYSG